MDIRLITKHEIGRALFHQVKKEDMTVNSSPYAEKVYEHLGFIATDAEQAELGMRYIPMKYSGKKLSEMSLDELWHLFPIRLEKPNSMWCRYYSDIEGTYSVDYMIGEFDYTGLGYGKEIIAYMSHTYLDLKVAILINMIWG